MGTVAADQPEPDAPFSPYDLTSSAFPHTVEALRVRETNISWVVFTGSFAYKIKSSVRFDFIDTSTLERRHDLCEEELRLNRRLAEHLYVEVVAITREAGGIAYRRPRPHRRICRAHETVRCRARAAGAARAR